MKKTVISPFYNEEYLLPWWLEHHKNIFDHGILLDYESTDRSCEIIKDICPTWEIRPSRNKYFNGEAIDAEIVDIEKTVDGWISTINVGTEFLYGNTDHLDDRKEPTQFMITNYVFVDMEDPAKGPIELSHDIPLHEQRYWGYHDNDTNRDPVAPYAPGKGEWNRLNRSIANYPVKYTGGRHFPKTDYSFDDLVIFYYGWADLGERGMARKTQIAGKINEPYSSIHKNSREQFLLIHRAHQQPVSIDMREKMANILEHNRRITGQNW
jgi:hypothetical protein